MTLGKYFSVAIDGPGGAGKSSAAKILAKELGFVYVDTGAMYRAVALFCMDRAAGLDEESVLRHLDKIEIELKYTSGEQRIFLGEGGCLTDVSQRIRTPEVSQGSSIVAVIPAVRDKLVSLQQKIAQNENIIMDGRDIGTRVLPFADIKIYLDANTHSRALRRLDELKQKGIDLQPEEVEQEIEQRDYRDMNREYFPLRQADDAILIDTSLLSLNEVVEKIKGLIAAKRSC